MFGLIRKVLLALVLAGLVFFAGRALYRYLAAPETKIRWRLEEMVAGFNAMRAGPVLEGISTHFVDKSAGISREELHSVLAWMFLNELDEHGEFLWSASFEGREAQIVVAPDKQSAEVECRVQFFRRRGAELAPAWDARIAGSFRLGEAGWQCSEVNAANHGERRER